MKDPWHKTTLHYADAQCKLAYRVPHDVFSTQRIDEGTLLLLENLPSNGPSRVLDMGCGYGALGLPLAARFKDAAVDLVDRDLLAVKWSELNAKENKLANARAFGSLGFRDIDTAVKYDWILCNVPARIGKPFIETLFAESLKRLAPSGELRVVVINDLRPLCEGLDEIAAGLRHSVFRLRADSKRPTDDFVDLYYRDHVTVAQTQFARPFDFGGDDQKRLTAGLPVLIDAMPRQLQTAPVLCFRSGYGIVPLLAKARWPQSRVTALERDLLGSTFMKMNAKTLNLSIDVVEAPTFEPRPEAFGLILGELSPSSGEEVAKREMVAIRESLSKGGQALVLCMDRLAKAVQGSASVVIRRDGYTVFRIA